MSSLRDKVSKNFSQSKKTEFERRVNELSGAMSEMAAIQLVLGEMFREGRENGGIMNMTISKNPNDPRNMTTNEIVFAIQDNRSTPEMFEELMLRGVDGVSSMMVDEIGGKKLDKPQKVYKFNPKKIKEGGVTEELLFRLRESNPDVYGEYFRPSLEKGPKFSAPPSRETFKEKTEGGISKLLGE